MSSTHATLKAHWELIEALGGPAKVASIIEAASPRKITPQGVSMMRKRGIAHRYRPILAEEAKARGLELPTNFLGAA
jgi:hypothetical protein